MKPPAAVIGLVTGVAIALTGLASSPLLAAPGTCHGLPVTVQAHRGTVVGTAGRDVIGLTGPARVIARGGDDIICGSRGTDRIHAGPGDDIVVARAGDDVLRGGPGTDRLFGEQGSDRLDGGPGRDYLMGGSGRDTVLRGRGTVKVADAFVPPWDVVVPGDQAISLSPQAPVGTGFYQIALTWNSPPAAAVSTGDASVPFTLAGPPVTVVLGELGIGENAMISIPTPSGVYIGQAQAQSEWAPFGRTTITGFLPADTGLALVPNTLRSYTTRPPSGSTAQLLLYPGGWWGVAGLTGQMAVDGTMSPYAPATGSLVLDPSVAQNTWEFQGALRAGPYAVTLPTPTSISLSAVEEAAPGWFLPPGTQPGITLNMNGPTEVQDVSWSPSGFRAN